MKSREIVAVTRRRGRWHASLRRPWRWRRGARRCRGLPLLVQQLELLLTLLLLLLLHLQLLLTHLFEIGLHLLHARIEQGWIRRGGGLRGTAAAARRQTQQRQGQSDRQNSSSHPAPLFRKPPTQFVRMAGLRFPFAALLRQVE